VEEREGGKGEPPWKRRRRWSGREKDRDANEGVKQREKKNRRGREKELPKDLSAILENCRAFL
jgi:hypothetical protein